ncbi:DUF58 domain-containing protein [Stenotrophomonas sp. YAU14D1_LEIMI4_1]|uniref:DUF58 domain-containing protein n=1 Tax=Stenotrophomonas sp. YAU14D1_LEIMI4_1 TaxID=2072407 RepID=UPI000D53CEA0|nr:DUF58 domain-containing protein [Stenotrophomonas sp. YAU14D1_LEIMI4_1]AWH26990.1 DUF58 domain-containing protein [Stenotrophomonas sp. YAU14D1_LEIMI4_1]
MRPAPLLLAVLLAWAALGGTVLGGLLPRWSWAAMGLAALLLALLDAWRVARQPSPQVQRQVPEALALGVRRQVGLRLQAARAQYVQVFDLAPGGWPVEDLPQRLQLRAGHASTLHYHVQPPQRGRYRFDGVHLRLRSPWRLWWQQRTLPPALEVRVYPNFVPLTRFALFSADQASRLVGAHVKRRRGEGTDFHQMREYRTGDSLRQLDWKATARARKLISREYQDEKNQQLLLMLDSGRRMLASEGGLSHFDHALNASLVVAYLALRQGDAVGLFAAGGERRWVAPQRGMGTVQHLLRASFDLQPQPVATDYLAAATEVSLRQQRRALVMLVSNVRDEDIEDLLAAVRLLQRRHLVCVASLRERELEAVLDGEVNTLEDAAQAGATALYLQQRAQAHDALRAEKVMVLDVTADALPAALVERYLSVKREGLL